MDAFVPDLVGDHERTLRVLADIFGEYRAALIVEDGARALERRVARRKPRQFKFEMLDGGIDQLHGLLGRPAARHLMVQAFGSFRMGSNESISIPERQQAALLLFA